MERTAVCCPGSPDRAALVLRDAKTILRRGEGLLARIRESDSPAEIAILIRLIRAIVKTADDILRDHNRDVLDHVRPDRPSPWWPDASDRHR